MGSGAERLAPTGGRTDGVGHGFPDRPVDVRRDGQRHTERAEQVRRCRDGSGRGSGDRDDSESGDRVRVGIGRRSLIGVRLPVGLRARTGAPAGSSGGGAAGDRLAHPLLRPVQLCFARLPVVRRAVGRLRRRRPRCRSRRRVVERRGERGRRVVGPATRRADLGGTGRAGHEGRNGRRRRGGHGLPFTVDSSFMADPPVTTGSPSCSRCGRRSPASRGRAARRRTCGRRSARRCRPPAPGRDGRRR